MDFQEFLQLPVFQVRIGIMNCYPPYTEHIEFDEVNRTYGPGTDIDVAIMVKDGIVVGHMKRGTFKVRAKSEEDANMILRSHISMLVNHPRVFRRNDMTGKLEVHEV